MQLSSIFNGYLLQYYYIVIILYVFVDIIIHTWLSWRPVLSHTTLPVRFIIIIIIIIIIRSIARLTVFYGFLYYFFFYSFEVRQYSINYVILLSTTTTIIIIIIKAVVVVTVIHPPPPPPLPQPISMETLLFLCKLLHVLSSAAIATACNQRGRNNSKLVRIHEMPPARCYVYTAIHSHVLQ